jgi:hypothetical protein
MGRTARNGHFAGTEINLIAGGAAAMLARITGDLGMEFETDQPSFNCHPKAQECIHGKNQHAMNYQIILQV